MHTLSKYILGFFLFIGLPAFVFAQGAKLPKEWTGYFTNQKNKLVILGEDFCFIDDFVPQTGFYEQVQPLEEGGYEIFIREYERQYQLPKLTIKKKGGKWELIYDRYSEKKYKLEVYEPMKGTKTVAKDLQAQNGAWFCGRDNITVEVDYNKVKIAGKDYEIKDAFQFIDDSKPEKYYILQGAGHKQLLSNTYPIDENYTNLRLIGVSISSCRKDKIYPVFKSTLFENLPKPLVGIWALEANPTQYFQINEDYSVQSPDGKGSVNRIGDPDANGSFNLEFQIGDKTTSLRLDWQGNDRFIAQNYSDKSRKKYKRVSQIQIAEESGDSNPIENLADNKDEEMLLYGVIGLAIVLFFLGFFIGKRRRKSDFV